MNRKSIKLLAISLALLISSSAPVFADTNVKRISGNDRYETAINVSKTYYERPEAVILASGENYPDALLGGSLSTQIKAPIILTTASDTSDRIINEIKRLSPKIIYCLGGVKTISDSNINKISRQTGIPFMRVAGKDRYETADKINSLRGYLYYPNPEDEMEYITNHYYSAVYGNNFYDALYAAPYYGAVKSDLGLLLYLELISVNKIRDSERITAHAIGDIDVIFDNSDDFNYLTQTRGKNRYETSVLMAEMFKKKVNNNLDTVVITSGETYPDGLSSAGVSAKKIAPVLLTSKNSLDMSVVNFIKNNNIKNVVIVGGENSVSKDVENELRNLN